MEGRHQELVSDTKDLELIGPIDKGALGANEKSKCLEIDYATKKFDVILDKIGIKEVKILASLSHLNLITYYFAIKNNANKKFEFFVKKHKKDYRYLGMELI